jgi:hypothetical protein
MRETKWLSPEESVLARANLPPPSRRAFDTARGSGRVGAVLTEIRNVKQERGAGRRRWFESEGLDLVVWLNAADAPTGFQLCYDVGRGERALTWRSGGGFTHSTVDEGDATPLKNETPILVPDGATPWEGVTKLFAARSGSLEPALRELVLARLAAKK